MSKAKVKVSVKPVKKGTGTLIASVPVSVEKNNSPTGKKMFSTTAQLTLRTKTKRNGEPRTGRKKGNR